MALRLNFGSCAPPCGKSSLSTATPKPPKPAEELRDSRLLCEPSILRAPPPLVAAGAERASRPPVLVSSLPHAAKGPHNAQA